METAARVPDDKDEDMDPGQAANHQSCCCVFTSASSHFLFLLESQTPAWTSLDLNFQLCTWKHKGKSQVLAKV